MKVKMYSANTMSFLADMSIQAPEEYDYNGAMYFAVAVILIYGISIAFLIGTTLRKSRHVGKITCIHSNHGHHVIVFHSIFCD